VPRALVFGVSGQDGAYLAQLLLEKGYAVCGTSRGAPSAPLRGVDALGIRGRIEIESVALTDRQRIASVIEAFDPDEIYNLAGQTSVGASFEHPVETFESIATATLHVLEALRGRRKPTRLFNAGSSECFGDTSGTAADEATPFRPQNPYAVAKAAAHWQVATYRDAYGMFACTGILFNHESPLRHERFVTKKVIAAAVRIAGGSGERLKLGDLSVQRDWGWAPEYVDAMWRMLQREAPEDFVLATGETHGLDAFVAAAFECVGLDWRAHVDSDDSLRRPTDVRVGRADPSRAAALLGWRATRRMRDVVASLVDAERSTR
jgi:GDPmannose 4,6-dehydratase